MPASQQRHKQESALLYALKHNMHATVDDLLVSRVFRIRSATDAFTDPFSKGMPTRRERKTGQSPIAVIEEPLGKFEFFQCVRYTCHRCGRQA
jgi:hypothetical protein